LGSEPDTGFTAVRGNSIVEQADDPVDVFVYRDRQQAFVRTDSRPRRHDISCRVTRVHGPHHLAQGECENYAVLVGCCMSSG
jgi:hypothetical protein